MSVAQLAAAADTTDETVEAVEDGRDELRWSLYCALADALGVEATAIVDRVAEESTLSGMLRKSSLRAALSTAQGER